MVNSPKKQRLGDKIAKSIVVNNEKKLPGVALIFILIAMFYLFTQIMGGTIRNVVKNSDAFAVTTEYINSNETIQESVGTINEIELTEPASISTTNGYGTAVIGVNIIGTNGVEQMVIHLQKEPDSEWKIIEVTY